MKISVCGGKNVRQIELMQYAYKKMEGAGGKFKQVI
jgi:hypothetical protein